MTSHISSVMGFLTTSLHKNCQNDVKLLETWWFWPILGKVERAELTCDVIKKSCSTFLIKFWLYHSNSSFRSKNRDRFGYFCPFVYVEPLFPWKAKKSFLFGVEIDYNEKEKKLLCTRCCTLKCACVGMNINVIKQRV